MRQAVHNLLERLLSGNDLRIEEILWLGLCVGLLFATVHLVTMLITRWGDHNTTSKSLIFSILVHVSCSLGLVAFHPPVEPVPVPEKKEDRIQVRDLFVEGEEKTETKETGNTPVWEKLLDPVKQQLSRLERTPLEPKPPESPERRPEETTQPDIDVPDLPSRPNEPIVTPKPEDRAEQGPRVESAIPLKIDDPTAEARPDVQIPSTTNTRRPLARSGQVQTQSVRRAPVRGSIDRVTKQFDASRSLASIDMPSDTSSFLKRGPDEDVIRRRAGPVPSSLPAEEAGMASDEPSQGTAGGAPQHPASFGGVRERLKASWMAP